MGLPSGYRRLEYIQSSGKQWIDTGFKPNQDTRVVMNCYVISFNSCDMFLFGARVSAGNTAFYIAADDTNTKWFISYGNNVQNPVGTCTGHHSIDMNKNSVSIDDAITTLSASTFQSASNLLLFATNTAGSADSQRGTMNLYSCQIYDNGTLVRDYIPCQTTAGEIGLWDDVNSVFYANAGTGAFTAGLVVDPYGNDESTLLLLHGEDLTDSSPYNKSITNNGASISSAQSKFGGASLYFNGEDAFMTVDLPVSGNCTVDFWIFALSYESSNSKYPTPIDYQGNSGLRGLYVHTNSSVTYYGASTPSQSAGHHFSADKLPLNEWHHIAVVREGTTVKCYLDGVLQGTLTGCYTLNDVLFIGNVNAGDYPFHGYLDEIRVSSIARWREDFTPPSKPYSSSLNLPVNIGGTWKDANEAFVNIGGAWKTVEAAYVNIGGTWKELG